MLNLYIGFLAGYPYLDTGTCMPTMIMKVGALHTHTSLPNMYHDNRGRLSAHTHTSLSNMYHNNRARHSAYHTLLPNMCHDTEVGTLLTTPCYLTCTMVAEVGSLLTTPCYLIIMYCNRDRHAAYPTRVSNMNPNNKFRICSPHLAML